LLLLATPLIFPRQGNYFVAIAFVAVTMSFWFLSIGGVRPRRRTAIFISGALILFAPLAPASFFVLLRLIETRSSYFEKRAQIGANAAALSAVAGGKAVLVPASHYFLFKERFDNIFNPEYLFPGYDPSDIGATVACRAATSGGDPFPPASDARPSSTITPNSPPDTAPVRASDRAEILGLGLRPDSLLSPARAIAPAPQKKHHTAMGALIPGCGS
jgi:hypothetical protein